jgi:hypothetical protein
MKQINKSLLVIFSLILLMTSGINAQYLEQRNGVNDESSISFDLETKANELGISTNQLQKILNSASNNGGGDPLPDAMQERFFTGQAAFDYFGQSISNAGDVNGDGYDDIIVGAAFNIAGKAYIYYGGSIVNSSADVIINGAVTDDRFGTSVSGAGDVNGDGYDDVIIGAPQNDANGNAAGRAYIYFGGSIMNTTVDVILTGAATGDEFGTSVSSAGDVNGDGFSDVIVGAYLNDGGGANTGRAYIYFGGSVMNNTADVLLTGEAVSNWFGSSVANAGDVNGDGFGDVIVGARGYSSFTGRAYIYYGGISMDNISDVIFTGTASNDRFSTSLSSAGDINGDGYSDVIIGAPLADFFTLTDAGRVFIYYGGASMDNISDITMSGFAAGDNFGYSVSAADINFDGYSDFIVGAYLNDVGGTNAGRVYVFYGGLSADLIPDVLLTGAAAGDIFGVSVSIAGDMNGDGYPDIIVGASQNDTAGEDAGRVYLYINSLTGLDMPDEFFTGAAAGDRFSNSVSNAGDVNGDGFSDIIVGAPQNDAGGSNAGRAYIYFGGGGIDKTADVILTGVSVNNEFGFSVSSAGDVNGDGYDDVIVGAYRNGTGGANAGRAYIYYGGSVMNNTIDVTLTGAAAGDYFGYAVSTAGDVNADGFDDVIVGAYQNDVGGNNAGRAYIFFGGNVMNNTADVILTGAVANDNFGISVSTAGDVNGDGYADVTVGAYGNDAGRAYIYFGGNVMNNTTDVILTGAAANDLFGISVSTAGDVNGDGYADVIVGAYGNDAGGFAAGRAYIFFGGVSMNNLADVTLTGAAAENFFGSSVSTAGDVNGDGYADVIVGAFGNNAGGFAAGRAYIFFGGVSMNNLADVTLIGAAAEDYFGNSVSTAGDINGDGYDDVIVGACFNDAGGTDAGRAYLYLSSPPTIKPRTMSVKDVPYDQGGKVYLNFVRSAYDALNESNIVTEYVVEMSTPPGVNGFSWSQIGSVQPMQNVYYTYIANTPNDSMINNSGTYYFRVTARTSNPNQYWRSNIIYGHSVDNLSPAAPLNFYANLNGSIVNLGWKANTEQDFRNYNIYRSDTPGLEDIVLIATTNDTIFIDNSPLAGNAYYYIQAFDIHDNGSPLSADSIETILSANIRIFLEGAYVGGQMSTFLNSSNLIPLSQPYNTSPWNYTGTESVSSIPQNIVDWVLVELRSSEITVAEIRAAFLKNDGTLVDLDGTSNIKFPSTPEGEYYVVIRHRNHLPIMTANKVGISFNPTLYDMRTDLTKAYGTNALKNLGGGFFGIFTADTDGSGTVNAGDRSNTWNQRNLSGYYATDVDLSGTVNAADRSAVWNNRNTTTQVPVSTDKLSTVKTSGVNENE